MLLTAVLFACGTANDRTSDAPTGDQAQAMATQLERDTAVAWSVVVHDRFGTPLHLAPSAPVPLDASAGASRAAITFLAAHRDALRMRDPASELEPIREEGDELGMTHARFRQVIRGVPVEGGELLAHLDARGALTSIQARYVPGLDAMSLQPAIGEADAIAKAEAALGGAAHTYRQAPSAKLVVLADEGKAPILAWHVTLLVGGHEMANWEIHVDAQTGDIASRYDNLQSVAGSGTGVLGDTKTLQVTQSGGTYQLVDTTRTPNGIKTYLSDAQDTLPGTAVSSTSATSWDANASTGKGAAVDAHYYAGVVYDYYKTTHGRASIDGADGAIISSVHFDTAYDNAFWDGQQMVYGDGDGTRFRAFSAGLDVIGHELTHGVTQNTSALVYKNQSGALNESVSDIFGEFVEHMAKPDPKKNLLVGEDLAIAGTGFRDMAHPHNGQQPANMSEYVNTQQDNGGVHTNSGIPNNAAYLMTLGGTNDVSKTQVQRGLGWDVAQKVWYRAAFHYFTSTTDFAGAARATLTAADDLKLSVDEHSIIECAWIATGVLTGTCKPLSAPTADAGAGPATGSSSGGTGGNTPPSPTGTGGTGSGNGENNSGSSSGGQGAQGDQPGSSTGTGGSSNGGRHAILSSPSSGSGCDIGGGGAGAGDVIPLLVAAAGLMRRRRKAR